MEKIIVKCGDEQDPALWGFVFNNRENAAYFAATTCFGKMGFRTLSADDECVKYLVDCRGCSDPGLGCSTCVKPDERLERDERLNEHFQEDI